MKRSGSVLGLICLCLFVLGTGLVHGQSTGSIAGWGRYVFVEPEALDSLVSVAAGGYHSLGLKFDGTIVSWGSNENLECTVPAPNVDFVAVAGGSSHSLGLKSNGMIVAWGFNYYGQCNVPAPNENFVAVAGSGYFSIGLKSDGTIAA
ncbi:MAG: hypothetical protein KAU49_04820, partial [Candidatus Krumholzibacteria bacterium]|nr:hypothetical protein [Candidatus Krumholzibacteria bacterium]